MSERLRQPRWARLGTLSRHQRSRAGGHRHRRGCWPCWSGSSADRISGRTTTATWSVPWCCSRWRPRVPWASSSRTCWPWAGAALSVVGAGLGRRAGVRRRHRPRRRRGGRDAGARSAHGTHAPTILDEPAGPSPQRSASHPASHHGHPADAGPSGLVVRQPRCCATGSSRRSADAVRRRTNEVAAPHAGRAHVLVNCAGVSLHGTFEQLTPDFYAALELVLILDLSSHCDRRFSSVGSRWAEPSLLRSLNDRGRPGLVLVNPLSRPSTSTPGLRGRRRLFLPRERASRVRRRVFPARDQSAVCVTSNTP